MSHCNILCLGQGTFDVARFTYFLLYIYKDKLKYTHIQQSIDC